MNNLIIIGLPNEFTVKEWLGWAGYEYGYDVVTIEEIPGKKFVVDKKLRTNERGKSIVSIKREWKS